MTKTPQQMNFFITCLLIYFYFIYFSQQERELTVKILVDYKFSIAAFPNIASGNLTSSISDHLPQFFIAPNIFLKPQA